MKKVPPGEAAQFIFGIMSVDERKMAVSSHLLPTYARVDLAFERGEGAWLFTAEGERYLDFTSGVAVNALGHAHPRLVSALERSGEEALARLEPLSHSGRREAGRAAVRGELRRLGFFQNSGTEAIECAIKMARKYQSASGKPERYRIVTFEGAFHGRTLAAIAATGNKKYLEGFGPPMTGFDQVPFADLEADQESHRPATGRHHDRADHGRGRRAGGAATISCARCASCATITACC